MLSEAKVGVGAHTKIVADEPHPALMRFAYSCHPPRKGEGEERAVATNIDSPANSYKT
jgi:hypothetical protein